MTEYKFHAVANIFPLIEGDELQALADDIRLNGQLNPIVLHPDDDTIVDGRNRYLACELEGIEPEFTYWDGKGDLVSFVVSLNLHRRHLNESQRAMVAARIANMDRGSQEGNLKASKNKPANLPISSGISQSDAAELLNAGERSLRSAKAVIDHGIPSLTKAVDSGKLPVSTAETISRLEPAQQKVVVERVEAGERVTAKIVRQEYQPEKTYQFTPAINNFDSFDEFEEDEDLDEWPEEEEDEFEEEEEVIVPDKMSIHYSSDSPEHYTPKKVVEATIKLFGAIDLDPCSNSKSTPNVPARKHYVVADDGLSLPWHGTVYMNPPYGRAIGDWGRKLIAEHLEGNVSEAIALVPSRTDTQWWIAFRDYPVCLVEGRFTFIGNDDPAPFPSAIFYLGRNVKGFVECFGDFGDIWERVK